MWTPFLLPKKYRSRGLWPLIAAVFAVTFALSWILIQRPASDLSMHTTWAGEAHFGDLTSFLHQTANPLWHCMVVAVKMLGVPLEISAAFNVALLKAAEVWLIHRLFSVALHDRLSPWRITLMTMVCCTLACLCLPWYNPTVYLGAGTPNTWHSSTQLSALVFMLPAVPYTAYCWDHFVELEKEKGSRTLLPWSEAIFLGVLLFFSLLGKPSFMQAFLPAACLYFLVKWIQYPKNSRYFLQIILCVLPSLVYMIVQYLYYYGIIVPLESNMVLQISWEKTANTLLRTLLMYAFPIYTLWSCRKQKKDTYFWLNLIFNIVAIVEFLILGEDGRRASDGNFGWGMMGASLMMFVMAMTRFLREEKKQPVGWVLLAWHWISGIYYIVYLFITDTPL